MHWYVRVLIALPAFPHGDAMQISAKSQFLILSFVSVFIYKLPENTLT